MAERISTAETKVTRTQLLSWNPNLLGLCDNLHKQYICAGAPGGSYIPPPVSNKNSTDAGQQRGGGSDGGGAIGGGRNSTRVPIGGMAPSPTQPGISPLCTEYVIANKGDDCSSLPRLWKVSAVDFFSWNQILGPNGENCDTQLFLGYYYCIDVAPTVTLTSSIPTSSTMSTPEPTQSGIISNCNKFAESIPGLGCDAFAAAKGITPEQLYTWNPILGIAGANCASKFWAGEYYCVGVRS